MRLSNVIFFLFLTYAPPYKSVSGASNLRDVNVPSATMFAYVLDGAGCTPPFDSNNAVKVAPIIRKRLEQIQKQILGVRKKFRDDHDMLSMMDALLLFKLKMIRLEPINTKKMAIHLAQLSQGLDSLLKIGKAHGFSVSYESPEKNTILDSQIADYIAGVIKNVDAAEMTARKLSEKGDLKAILKTGSYVLLMFSTTADVCVYAGWGPCIVLYTVGSGALFLWLAQILNDTFGEERVLFVEHFHQ